jgi:hypothetical protein
MDTHAQKFRHGTSAFWHVNVTKIGIGAAKFKRHEVVSARLSSGAVPKFRKKFKMCSTSSMRKTNCPLFNMAAMAKNCNLPKKKVKKQI